MTDQQAIKKQFIAGAKCPACGAMDSLVFYREDDQPVRECVDCDFKEVLGVEDEKGQKNSALAINVKELL